MYISWRRYKSKRRNNFITTNQPWQVLECPKCKLTLENCKCHPIPCLFCKEEYGSVQDWNVHIDELHDQQFRDAVNEARKKQPVQMDPLRRDLEIKIQMLNCLKVMLVGLLITLGSIVILFGYVTTHSSNFMLVSAGMFLIGMMLLVGGSYCHGRLYNLQKRIREERIMKERSEKVYQYFWNECSNIKSHEEFAKSGFLRCSLCGYPKYGKQRED